MGKHYGGDYFPSPCSLYDYFLFSKLGSNEPLVFPPSRSKKRHNMKSSSLDIDDVRPSKIGRTISHNNNVKYGEGVDSSDLPSDEFKSSDLTSSSDSSSSSSSSSETSSYSDPSSDSSLCSSSSDDDDDDDRVARLSELDKYLRPDINFKDQQVDLIPYLSRNSRDFLVDKNGRKVDVKSSIQGKYVILIWLKLPVDCFSLVGRTCRALQSACSTSTWTNNVQVVIIPSMSLGWESRLDAFDSFLSGLPSCLAIPLGDSAFYSSVWDYYHIRGADPRKPYTIVLDPNQIVLQQDCYETIIHHGAAFYPFTMEHLATLNKGIKELLLEKPFPLERLLGLQLSDCLSNVAGDANITVSDLKNKLVGVYLSFSGFQLFNAINRAHQYCLAKDRELEIVLVCINLVDDPQHYMAGVCAALRDKGISTWWVLPYNDSTHRRLWKLCDEVEEYEILEKLIIVGPQGHFFDREADYAISYDPIIHDMYPYAIEPIVQQETGRLQKLTLESLLLSSPTTHDYLVTQQGNLVPVTELRGKNVLLFIADFERNFDAIMDEMRNYWCLEIKEKCNNSNTVVVFVPLHSSGLIFTKDLDARMFWLWDPTISWLISPPSHVRDALIIKDTSLKGLELDQLSCIAFGEDGQLVSKDLSDLSKYMANDFPLDHLFYHVLGRYRRRFRKRWQFLGSE